MNTEQIKSMMKSRKIELHKINTLNPYDKNANIHPENQIENITKSMTEYGWTTPILIDDKLNVIAGHGRIMAAKRIGLDTAPCIKLSGLTDDQRRALVIADNQIAKMSYWDVELLQSEIVHLESMHVDIHALGFADGEIAALMPEPTSGDDSDVLPATTRQRCNLGDTWQLGDHSLRCMDSTTVGPLWEPDLVFYDPPYEIKNIYDHIPEIDDCNYLVMSMRQHIHPVLDRCIKLGFDFKFEYIMHRKSPWLLDNSLPLVTHKNIFWFTNGKPFHDVFAKMYPRTMDEMESPKIMESTKNGNPCITSQNPNGKRLQSVIEYRMDDEKIHPHQKPVQMMEFMVAIHAKKHVFDMFSGSGSTIIACENTGKICDAIELDPINCDLILTRWENHTGKIAVKT